MSIRTEKVASVLKKALVQPLTAIAGEIGAGLVSITQVRVSPDLRNAKVYVSFFGGTTSAEQALRAVQERAKAIRHEVTGSVQLRFSPEMKFFLDDTLDTMSSVDALLEKARNPAPLDFTAINRGKK
jgi:ribosome-binding factor A